MASGKYEAYSILLLNWLFGGGTFAQPSDLYIALFSVTPSVSSVGTEATGGAYARITVACNTTNWPAISGSTTTITNNVAQTFAAATGDWSSAANQVAAGIVGSLAGSLSTYLYYWGALTEAKPVLNGDTASFAISAITVQEL
jgi:hypothetical protein